MAKLERDFIVTKDMNEVAKIHSDLRYMNWRCEFVDGEYRFYSPNYKISNTITFYHGGVEPDFNISQLEVLRSSQNQQKETTDYAGFYMYSEQNHEDTIQYAIRENGLKNTNTKGVIKISMPSDIKIYTSVTRVTKEQIEQLKQQGYDVIAGRMLGKTEYVLLNKDKILDIQFQPLEIKQKIIQEESSQIEKKEEEIYVTLEQLEPLLSESGYMCFGHGTGRKGNFDEVVDSIFSEGLRTKDNSLYFTSIGLSTPTPELKAQYKELGLPEPSIEDLKTQFNNWQHQDSKKIIIARVPTEFINNMGDRSDRDGEMFGAFYIEKLQTDGKVTNYLDSKFIIGCFDVEKQAVRLNKQYERILNPETLVQLRERYKKVLEKTKARIDRTELSLTPQSQVSSQEIPPQSYDLYNRFDFPEIEWKEKNTIGKTDRVCK